MFLGLMFCLAIAIPILIADDVNALFLELYSHSTEYLLYVVIYGFLFLILGWVPGQALAFLYRHRLTSSKQGIGTKNGSMKVYLEQKRPRLDLQNTLCMIAIGAALCFYTFFMGYNSIESPSQYKRAFPSEINSSKDNEFSDKHLSPDQWVVVFEKSSMYCLEKYSITSDGELTIDTSSHIWVNADNILISDLSYSKIVLKNHLENDEK